MKKICAQFQKMMAAATFAEAGEWLTARQMLPADPGSREAGGLARVFSAVAFAEAGLHETARQFIAGSRLAGTSFVMSPADIEGLGLQGYHLVYGYVSVES
jgi:hypothetical protein